MEHLRSEGGADKLPIGRVRDRLEHLRHSRSVLGIQVGVDLVEEVERRRVTCLDGEDQGEGAQTW